MLFCNMPGKMYRMLRTLKVLFGAVLFVDQCRGIRDRAALRELWKKAINQQILLIRMERENAKLYGKHYNDEFDVY